MLIYEVIGFFNLLILNIFIEIILCVFFFWFVLDVYVVFGWRCYNNDLNEMRLWFRVYLLGVFSLRYVIYYGIFIFMIEMNIEFIRI